jgi:squalene monooxygenase
MLWIAALVVLLSLLILFRYYRQTHQLPKDAHLESNPPQYDVIVIGAGVVGAALATTLGKQGKRVLVVEASLQEPDRIVGELMQPRGVESLKKLGLGECVEGIDAHVVDGYAVYYQKEHFRVNYPDNACGAGFHNGRFVMKLREAAMKVPSVKVVEGSVTGVLYEESSNCHVRGITYKPAQSSTEEKATATLTIIASGCLTTLRKQFTTVDSNNTAKHTISRFLGFVLEDCDTPYENLANVFLTKDTPVLCYPIASRESRVLVDFSNEKASLVSGDVVELKNYLINEIMPYFPEVSHPSFRKAIEKGKFQSMPNQSMTAFVDPKFSGVLVVGDALNMRHPLTGGGMTVGMKDVEILTELLSHWTPTKHATRKEEIELVYSSIREFYELRKRPNAVINMLADALYWVFNQKYATLRDSCYAYLARGGFWSRGPITFLGGISENQPFLLFHFFAVAVYAVFNLLFPFPSPSGIVKSYHALRDSVHIISPLVQRSGTDLFLCGVIRVLRLIFP